MKQLKNKIDVKSITSIGFEYEFYSSLKPHEIRKEVRAFSGFSITYIEDIKTINSWDILKTGRLLLTIDKSGGKEMYELITPPLPYYSAISFLKQMNSWLSKNGIANKYASLHININLGGQNIKNLDILKFILSFNEDLVYEHFPNRKNNIYCNSIKYIVPKNKFLEFKPEFKYNYLYPDTKYFGVNFLKLKKNYLEYRYIGGKNYFKKTDSIILLIEYFISHLYDVLNNKELTVNDRIEFEKLLKPANDLKKNLYSYEAFMSSLGKKINLTADLSSDKIKIKTFWTNIRNHLSSLFLKNKIIGAADINYNSDLNLIEIANTKVKGIYLSNYGFYNCKVSGIVHSSLFKNCELNNISIYSSKVYDSELNNGKLFNSLAINCEYNMVYVSNPNDKNIYISGTFNEGVINFTYIDKDKTIFNEDSKDLIKIIKIKEI